MEPEMPQRFLRPGITNSERWNLVSWPAQSLFVRLLTLVDDYGRCDGRPAVICGQCFSVWNSLHAEDQYDFVQVDRLLQELAASCLISRYSTDGKTVIQVSQWQERIREGVKERFPENPNKNDVAASCCKLLPSSPSSSSSSSPLTLAQKPEPSPTPSGEIASALSQKREFELKTTMDYLTAKLFKAYNRDPNRRLCNTEEPLIAEIARRPDAKRECDRILHWKASIPSKELRYFPQSIERLLNAWNSTLDKADAQLDLESHHVVTENDRALKATLARMAATTAGL